ncbi:MAG: HAD family phosphatase [Bacteroidaceae bacterium]|nr:HAD family phosphatase [Bacteroidaceae bacterium]
MNIKNIIIDLGGVIINVDMMCTFKAMEKLGVDVQKLLKAAEDNSANNVGAVVCEGLSVSGVLEQYQVGKVSSEDFINGILALCNKDVTRQQAIDAWNVCLFDIPEERLDIIRQLKEKYNVYLLSNTNDIHWIDIENRFFSKSGHTTDCFFHKVFLSHEMHLAKPDPRIYEQLLKEIGAKGDECLFFDDSSLNLRAAETFGIHTYHALEGLPIEYCKSLL